MTLKAFNIASTETINKVDLLWPKNSEQVPRNFIQKAIIVVSIPSLAISNLTSDEVKRAVIDDDANIVDIIDPSSIVQVRTASPSGTATVSAGSTALAVAGGAMVTEAQRGDFVYFTDSGEWARIKSITSNTAVVLFDGVKTAVSGGAFVIYNNVFGMTGGPSTETPTAALEKVELSYDTDQVPTNWSETEFSTTQIKRTSTGNPNHVRFTIAFIATGDDDPEIDAEEDYYFHINGVATVIQPEFVDQITG